MFTGMLACFICKAQWRRAEIRSLQTVGNSAEEAESIRYLSNGLPELEQSQSIGREIILHSFKALALMCLAFNNLEIQPALNKQSPAMGNPRGCHGRCRNQALRRWYHYLGKGKHLRPERIGVAGACYAFADGLSPRLPLSRASVCMQSDAHRKPSTRSKDTPSSNVYVFPSVRLLLQHATFGEAFTVEGWVRKSTIHKRVGFLYLGDGESDEESFLRADLEMPKKRMRLYAPGSHVAVSGVLEKHRWGWPHLRVKEAQLLRAAPLAASICRVLSAASAAEGLLSPQEAKAALLLDVDAPLPSPEDKASLRKLVAPIQRIAPSGAILAANGVKPKPSAAHDPQLCELSTERGMERACLALEAAGGAAAAATAVGSDRHPLGRLIVVEGEVTGLCKYSNGFSTIDLCTNENTNEEFVPQRCLLHSSLCRNYMQAYCDLAAKGARVRFAGVWAPQEEASNLLLVSAVRLLRSSMEHKAVHSLLRHVANGTVNAKEAMAALCISTAENASEDAPQTFRRELQAKSGSELLWRVSELQRELVSACAAQQHTQDDLINYESALQSLESFRARYPLRSIELHQGEHAPNAADAQITFSSHQQEQHQQGEQPNQWRGETRPKRCIATATSRQPLLREGRDGSFWQTKKRPQVLFMTQVIEDLMKTRPDWNKSDINSAHILDIGGSKGLLAQHLVQRFGSRVNVTVVDIDESRIRSGSKRAEKNFGSSSNLRFVAGDASELTRSGILDRVDVVVGLHACGGLSDVILGHAVAHGAAFAVTTCCYLSNQQLEIQASNGSVMMRGKWLGKATAPAVETSVAPAAIAEDAALTPELLHIVSHAAERQFDPVLAALGAHTVNAIRARAVEWHWAQNWQRQSPQELHGEGSQVKPLLLVELLSFEPKYSPRNFAIVGTPVY